jgi:hypothetical protein
MRRTCAGHDIGSVQSEYDPTKSISMSIEGELTLLVITEFVPDDWMPGYYMKIAVRKPMSTRGEKTTSWHVGHVGQEDFAIRKCPARALNWLVKRLYCHFERVGAAIRIQRCWRTFKARREKSAKVIQRQWRESIANPAYQSCRRRLAWEYGDLHVTPLKNS